jgi:thiol-disulfide isomerase/thioredoxin
MKKFVLHLIGYTLVAGGSFWGGALTRDYLVTREAREQRGRYAKFLNQPAPSLASHTLDGVPWDLQAHKGKVVVIEAWATWCGPCIASLPKIKHIHERFGQRNDFMLVGVSLDKEPNTVKRFCADQGITWLQLIEPGKKFDNSIARALEVKGIPFMCIVDRKGVVRTYQHASGDIERLIERLLAEPDPVSQHDARESSVALATPH